MGSKKSGRKRIILREDFLLYRRWLDIKKRCFNKNSTSYKNYGGRGITMSNEWLVFKNFKNDMGKTFKKELSIERINNDGNYTKNNCCWADNITQVNNSRKVLNAKKISYMGITDTISHWAKYLKIKRTTIDQRRRYSWSVERILFEPVNYQLQK